MEWFKNLQKVTDMFSEERWLAAAVGLVFGLVVGLAVGISAGRQAEIHRTVSAVTNGVYTYKQRSWLTEPYRTNGKGASNRAEPSPDYPETRQSM